MKKKININRSNNSKLDYISELRHESTELKIDKKPLVRKSILIDDILDKKIKDYIYEKRVGGDIYYNQTNLIKDALNLFFNHKK